MLTNNFAQWRELLNTRYGVSNRNDVVNENIQYLQNMKLRIDDKINNIREDRQQNLNLLKKEMSARLYQYQTELNDLKKEVADKMQEMKTPVPPPAAAPAAAATQYLRRNKRKRDTDAN
jgi:spore cortex formation protein SpoVR/YcgB (stage V sporulation)